MDNNQRISFDRKTFEKMASLVESLAKNIDRKIDDKIKSNTQNIDQRTDSKINDRLLKHLDLKWNSLSIILTGFFSAFAINLVIVIFVINTSVSQVKADVRDLKIDMHDLVKMQSVRMIDSSDWSKDISSRSFQGLIKKETKKKTKQKSNE